MLSMARDAAQSGAAPDVSGQAEMHGCGRRPVVNNNEKTTSPPAEGAPAMQPAQGWMGKLGGLSLHKAPSPATSRIWTTLLAQHDTDRWQVRDRSTLRQFQFPG